MNLLDRYLELLNRHDTLLDVGGIDGFDRRAPLAVEMSELEEKLTKSEKAIVFARMNVIYQRRINC